MIRPQRFNLLGAHVDAFTAEQWLDLISECIVSGSRITIVSQNLHGIHSYHHNAEVRSLHAEAFVRIDGMPLVLWGKALGSPLRRTHRVTWIDWLPPFLEYGTLRGWRMFHLGGAPGVADQAAHRLRERIPGVHLSVRHGHFALDEESNAHVVAEVNSARPDVLLVGMGMPRQEKWVLRNRHRLSAPVVLTCGAAFEYFAGTMSASPRWMGSVGLEWLHRLATSPGRVYRRYLIEPWSLVPHAFADIRRRLHSKSFHVRDDSDSP